MTQTDQPAAVRPGEEIDTGRLREFLAEQSGEAIGELKVLQFPAGHSNLTYLLSAGDREFVLRRPPQGTRPKSGHDMAREFRILQGLSRAVSWAPTPIALCEDEAVLGAPFFVMERVRGVILRGSGGGLKSLGPDDWQRLSTLCVDTLAAVHDVDLVAAGLEDLGRPEGYIRRQVDGWRRRWERARTHEVSELEESFDWLEATMPGTDERYTSLIHNDFKFDNLVLSEDLKQVRAVLDWELATVGDRRMDLGTSLAYWAEPGDEPILLMMGLSPTPQPGNLSRQGVVDRYAGSGMDLEDPSFFYVYGLCKVAVIGQQIFYRFHHGQTADPRFAGLLEAVRALGRQAQWTLRTGRLSRP
jgi:aminoglycoside phosphotransferase (APT) family kinase protein